MLILVLSLFASRRVAPFIAEAREGAGRVKGAPVVRTSRMAFISEQDERVSSDMQTSLVITTHRCGRAYLFAWFVLVGLLAACGEPLTSPSPSSPARLGSPAPQPNPQTGPALTGGVFQTNEQGRRPVSGARVFVVDLIEGPYGNYPWFELVSDANGRFSVNVYQGRPVKVTAYDGAGSGLWNQSGLHQVCAVHPTINGDTTADVELVQAGVLPTTYGPPTLSGVVFDTSNGRRPVGGTPVLYSSNSHDGADVYTRTDAEGRYTFCRLPVGPGYVLAGCPGALTPFPGFRVTKVSVEIHGDTVLDVDITTSFSSCPSGARSSTDRGLS